MAKPKSEQLGSGSARDAGAAIEGRKARLAAAEQSANSGGSRKPSGGNTGNRTRYRAPAPESSYAPRDTGQRTFGAPIKSDSDNDGGGKRKPGGKEKDSGAPVKDKPEAKNKSEDKPKSKPGRKSYGAPMGEKIVD